MSNKAIYYQTDFKPDYEVFQQKVSQLSRQKNRIHKTQINIENLKHQLELINQEIQDQGLSYDNNNIFLRYATIQQLAQKKKTASDCCMHCGQEMKKIIQCQFCAQLYCKNCCWRKRVIPFQQHQDFRLCCEECHEKYIKHFNNQQFYKQKAIYLAAIDQLERKFDKTRVKYDKKQNEVKEYKEQKRTIKIKQGNLKKALLQEQKAIKILTQEYEKAIQNKALQIKAEQDRQKNQNKQLQEEKLRFEKQKQIQQEKRAKQLQQEQYRILQNSRKKEQELAQRQAEIKREKQQLEKQKKQLSESRLRQIQESHKIQKIQQNYNKKEEQTQKNKPEEVIEKFDDKKSQKQKEVQITKDETPRKVVFNQELDFDAILKDDQKPKEEPKQGSVKKQNQNQQKQNEVTLKQFLKEMKESKRIEEKPQDQVKNQVKQDKGQKSQTSKKSQQKVNEAPRLTMTQIKTMSMNDLLSMKIPMNPGSQQKRPRKASHPEIKVEAQQNSTTTQNEKMYQSLLEPFIPLGQSSLVGLALPAEDIRQSIEKQDILRQSIKSVHEQVEEQNDKENQKRELLMRQSLLSSSNKVSVTTPKQPEYNDEQTAIGQPQKCTCEIM